MLAWRVGWWGSPLGGSVGGQAGYGGLDLGEVLSASDVPLKRPPLLVLGVGVLDADVFRGLLMAGRFPSSGYFGQCALLGFSGGAWTWAGNCLASLR